MAAYRALCSCTRVPRFQDPNAPPPSPTGLARVAEAMSSSSAQATGRSRLGVTAELPSSSSKAPQSSLDLSLGGLLGSVSSTSGTLRTSESSASPSKAMQSGALSLESSASPTSSENAAPWLAYASQSQSHAQPTPQHQSSLKHKSEVLPPSSAPALKKRRTMEDVQSGTSAETKSSSHDGTEERGSQKAL